MRGETYRDCFLEGFSSFSGDPERLCCSPAEPVPIVESSIFSSSKSPANSISLGQFSLLKSSGLLVPHGFRRRPVVGDRDLRLAWRPRGSMVQGVYWFLRSGGMMISAEKSGVCRNNMRDTKRKRGQASREMRHSKYTREIHTVPK